MGIGKTTSIGHFTELYRCSLSRMARSALPSVVRRAFSSFAMSAAGTGPAFPRDCEYAYNSLTKSGSSPRNASTDLLP